MHSKITKGSNALRYTIAEISNIKLSEEGQSNQFMFVSISIVSVKRFPYPITIFPKVKLEMFRRKAGAKWSD